MPTLKVLDNPEYRKKLYLPSTAAESEENKAWVVMDTSPLISADIVEVDPMASLTKTMAFIVSRRVKEWNFTEADGSKIEITFENVCRLPIADLRFLNGEVEVKGQTVSEEQKKTLSDTLETPQPAKTTISVDGPSQ